MPSPRVSRQDLVDQLRRALEAEPAALAAYVGGSEASGRLDARSDIDLVVVAERADVERVFATVARALEALSPIAERYRTPEPTWHGMSQEFLQVADADPDHVIDLVVAPRDLPVEKRLTERERHGEPVVWFDRVGEARATTLDRAAQLALMEKRLADLRARFVVFQPVVSRAAGRGFPAEALACYVRFTVTPLVDLLRLRHAPVFFDFGLRYLDRDLPDEPRAFVESRMLPRDLGELERFREELVARFARELDELDRGAWRPAL
ncbi:MAG: hypothetical protein H6828_06685 [Planctomycetes bacterium]|nr:hypothetical protein [Planctomycetota bacterium]